MNTLHKEVFMQLPQYVNGTLEPGELNTVQHHMEQCEDCQREVIFLNNMLGAVDSMATVSALPKNSFDKLLSRIEEPTSNEHQQHDSKSSLQDWFTTVAEWLRRLVSFDRPVWVQAMPALGVAVVVGSLVAVNQFDSTSQQSAGYRDITGNSDARIDPDTASVQKRRIEVKIVESSAISVVSNAVNEILADQPVMMERQSTDTLLIQFGPEVPETSINRLITQLRNSDQVVHVSPN